MKQKKYKWAVRTECKGRVQWKSFAFCESRKIARQTKKSQKAIWRMCHGVEVSIHKVRVTKAGNNILSPVYY